MDKNRALNLDDLDKVVGGVKEDPKEKVEPWYMTPPGNTQKEIDAWLSRYEEEFGVTSHAAAAKLDELLYPKKI